MNLKDLDRYLTKINKINTKEELILLLQNYKGILSKPTIEYLNSLIELEFSVIRDCISDKDRAAISELEVYKKIAIYNIYNKALNLFNESKSKLSITGNNEENEGLIVYYAPLKEKCIKLFDFCYREGPLGFESQIPKGYKTMKIGNISLYQTLENSERREKEVMRILSELHELYDEKNPCYSNPNAFGGPFFVWEVEHKRKIVEYEKKFQELDGKKGLTDEEKREIEITNKFHNLLLEDYGLTNKSFEASSNNKTLDYENEMELSKTFVKKLPNIRIKNNIKFI